MELPNIQNVLLAFNCQRKPLDNMKVRQALSYAIPYQDIILAATNSYAKQSKGPLPENVYPHDPSAQAYADDVAKAKNLLAQAGHPNGGFSLTMTYSSDDGYGPKLAPLVKEGFAKVGVTLNLQPLLFEQAWAKAKGPAAQRQDIWENLWWPAYPDGYDTLFSIFHSESETIWNCSYWYNKRYDNLIDTAYSAEPVNPAKAQQLYNQAQQMLIDQAPSAYLFDPAVIYGVLPSLKLDSFALNPSYPGVLSWYHVSQ